MINPDTPGANSTGRLGSALLLVAALSMPIALCAIVVGGHDTVLASRTVDKLIGAIIALTGLALLAAACLVFGSIPMGNFELRRRLRDLAVVGFLAGTFPGVALCLVQVTSSTYSWRLVPCVLVVAVPALGTALLVAQGARPRIVRPLISVSIAATLVGAGLPLIAGAFKTVTDAAIPNLDLVSTVVGSMDDGQGNPVALIESTLTVSNISKRRLVIVGSMYTIYGATIRVRNQTTDTEDHETFARELQQQYWSGRHEAPSPQRLVEGGLDVFRPGHVLEPGQHSASHIVTPIPLARANVARVVVTMITGFGDRIRLGTENHHFSRDKPVELNGNPIHSRWGLQPTGWIEGLAIGGQQLRVEYKMEKASADHASAFSFRMGLEGQLDGQPFRSANRRLDQYDQQATTTLGLGTSNAHTLFALILPPVAGAA